MGCSRNVLLLGIQFQYCTILKPILKRLATVRFINVPKKLKSPLGPHFREAAKKSYFLNGRASTDILIFGKQYGSFSPKIVWKKNVQNRFSAILRQKNKQNKTKKGSDCHFFGFPLSQRSSSSWKFLVRKKTKFRVRIPMDKNIFRVLVKKLNLKEQFIMAYNELRVSNSIIQGAG